MCGWGGVQLTTTAQDTDGRSNIHEAIVMPFMSSGAAEELQRRVRGESTVVATIPQFSMHHNHGSWQTTLATWMETPDIQAIGNTPMFANVANDLLHGRIALVTHKIIASIHTGAFVSSPLRLYRTKSSWNMTAHRTGRQDDQAMAHYAWASFMQHWRHCHWR